MAKRESINEWQKSFEKVVADYEKETTAIEFIQITQIIALNCTQQY